MKKIKWILLILTIFLMIVFIFATCKKTKALESPVNDIVMTISARDQDKYNAVFIYDLGNANGSTSIFLVFESQAYLYCYMVNNNELRIETNYQYIQESYSITDTRLLEFRVVYDVNSLFLIIYKINFSLQQSPGLAPSVDGISRTMLTRYNISATSPGLQIVDWWENQSVDIHVSTVFAGYEPNMLFNCAYISYSESNNPTSIDTWSNSQLSNYITLNNLLARGYNYGYTDGYDEGYTDGAEDGEEIGYDNGYDDGEEVGYNNGYGDGLSNGFDLGYQSGYTDGYTDGENGESAVSKAVGVIGSVFGAVGTVLSIELFPGIPLGLFFLVPLFFAVVGLILWIWRRN